MIISQYDQQNKQEPSFMKKEPTEVVDVTRQVYDYIVNAVIDFIPDELK